ncbi:MAG: hypothetical protein H0X39_17350 [Actinobacteria bacterium]|nr:hypothetical protein [Actinomycetota bacterium]
MSVDRHAPGYEPRFDLDSVVGRQGELFAQDIARGLADGTVEVKTDEASAYTGNVYVEYQCLRSKGWMPSGIATTEAEWWAFVLGPRKDVLFALSTDRLRKLVDHAQQNPWMRKRCVKGGNPTYGVAIPMGQFVEGAVGTKRKAA